MPNAVPPSEPRAAARSYACFVALLAAYYVTARLVNVRPVVGTSVATVLGLDVIPDLVGAYLVTRAAWIALRTRTFAQLRPALRADLLSWRTAERLVGIPIFVGGTVVVFDVYGAFKQAIPRLSSYGWDVPLADLDRALHLGRDAWRLTSWIPQNSWAYRLLDEAYTAWFLSLILSVLIFATWSPSRLRARFFISLTVLLMLGGTLGAIVFASGGPVYYAELTGDAQRFAPLLEYIGPTDARLGQRILWDFYATGSEKLYGGISAMPSMHVAMVALMTLGFTSWNVAAGGVVAVYALLILIGSVHLGWHYAVDGYVSVLLAFAVWLGSGWLARRFGWTDDTSSEVAPPEHAR
jgi:membrane-associated phospholipid phosphatase